MAQVKRAVHIINDMNKIAGAEQSLINFVNSCGYSVYLISLRPIIDENALKSLLHDNVTLAFLDFKAPNFLLSLVRLRRQIASFEPDVVVSWMYHANVITSLALLLMRCKPAHIWTIHHNFAGRKNESFSTLSAIAASSILARLPLRVAYASVRAMQSHARILTMAKSTFVLPNIIIGEIDLQRPIVTKPRVGIAGRFHAVKGYDLFFSVVRLAKAASLNAEFVACGEGVEFCNAPFEHLASESALTFKDIKTLGNVRDMSRFYSNIDVLLCCSREEGFGMVLAEAIAHGVPVISTDVGAAREIVGSDGGIVISVRSAEVMYGALVNLLLSLNKPEFRFNIVHASNRIRSIYGPKTVHEGFRQVIVK